MRFPWIRSIIAISFQEDAPLAARQEAVDRVKGVVVGGLRLGGDDGEYYVRIPDTTFAGIERALAIIRKMPQVAVAHPMTLEKMGPPPESPAPWALSNSTRRRTR